MLDLGLSTKLHQTVLSPHKYRTNPFVRHSAVQALEVALLGFLFLFAAMPSATAQGCPSTNLTNNTTADADGVMAWLNCKASLANPVFSGNVGIGTFGPIGYPLTIEGPDRTSASAALAIQTPNTGEQAAMFLSSGATPKWQLGKNTDDSFFLWDTVGNRNDIAIQINGDMSLMTGGGNVGIGTGGIGSSPPVPASILHLYRTNSGSTLNLIIDNDASTPSSGQGIQFNSGTMGAIGGIFNVTDGTQWALRFKAWNGSAETERLTILGLNGNVGIANSAPRSQFEVGPGTSNAGSPVAMFGGSASGAAVNVLSLVNSTTAALNNEADLSFHLSSSYSATAVVGAVLTSTGAPTTDLLFSTYGGDGLAERMRVTNTGYVGIGTSAPTSRLDMTGAMSAPSWGTTGLEFAVGADTLADTSSTSTTIPTRAASSFGIPTFAAHLSGVVLSEGATVYVDGPPTTSGSNITLNASQAFDIIANSAASAGETTPILIRNRTATTGSSASLAFGVTSGAGVITSKITDYRAGSTSHSLVFSTWNMSPLDPLHPVQEAMRITGAGHVGIGTATPGQALEVAGTIRQSGCTTAGTLSTNTSGDIICTSDARLKNIIGPYNGGLGAIDALEPTLFRYKSTKSDPVETFVHAGFIAQNVKETIPQAVAVQKSGYYSLDTTAILAAAVNAIKELKAENQKQSEAFASLQKVNAAQAQEIRLLKRDADAIRDIRQQISAIRRTEGRGLTQTAQR